MVDMTSDLSDVSSGIVRYDIYHPRHACLTIASSLGMGLSVPNRSIHKCQALPPGDYGYTKCQGYYLYPKGYN